MESVAPALNEERWGGFGAAKLGGASLLELVALGIAARRRAGFGAAEAAGASSVGSVALALDAQRRRGLGAAEPAWASPVGSVAVGAGRLGRRTFGKRPKQNSTCAAPVRRSPLAVHHPLQRPQGDDVLQHKQGYGQSIHVLRSREETTRRNCEVDGAHRVSRSFDVATGYESSHVPQNPAHTGAGVSQCGRKGFAKPGLPGST